VACLWIEADSIPPRYEPKAQWIADWIDMSRSIHVQPSWVPP
jgi:hypothetical protein